MACHECTDPSPRRPTATYVGHGREGAEPEDETASVETSVGRWELERPMELHDQLRSGSQQCLGTWKGDLPLDGSPLVFAPCVQPRTKPNARKLKWRRTVAQQQQQWLIDAPRGRIRARHAPHLCVTATPVHVAKEGDEGFGTR